MILLYYLGLPDMKYLVKNWSYRLSCNIEEEESDIKVVGKKRFLVTVTPLGDGDCEQVITMLND